MIFHLSWCCELLRICNLSSVPRITQLLVDVIISGKTNPCSGSKKQQRSNDQVRNKTISTNMSFFRSLYLKQHSNILFYFCSSKFEEKKKNSNKLFSCIFCSKRTVYTVGKDKIKYLIQNQLVKITFLYVQTYARMCFYCLI